MDELREHAFSASPVAQIVVTEEDVVALVNRQAETTFGLSSKDVGRPLRDVDISYRPVELRGYVEQARLERKSLRIKDVEWLCGPASRCGSRCTSTRSSARTTPSWASRSSSTT
ncbi:PAS domain S-box protein [Lentzea rhizosphaerae]|uniref:PAS domain S-box protein n=1 Tax=Lentzea rhizosphaerae TaxID=2041025 RepID=A0ABV8C452_9PSEU